MKQPYKLKDGSIVPGCTTICNMLDKPQLLKWVARLTKEGKDWEEERDSAGDIGTLVHELVLDFLSGEEVVMPEDDVIGGCFDKFLKWWVEETKNNEIEIILIEQSLISERLGFGGQPDIYLFYKNLNKYRLPDIKTSGGIYDSHWYQLAGYDILICENGYPKPDEYQILWLPKDDRFDAPIRTDLRREKRIFRYLLSIYQERKANEPPF